MVFGLQVGLGGGGECAEGVVYQGKWLGGEWGFLFGFFVLIGFALQKFGGEDGLGVAASGEQFPNGGGAGAA